MNLKVFDLLARSVDFSVGAILDGSCMLDYGVAFFAGGFQQLLDTYLGRLPFVLSLCNPQERRITLLGHFRRMLLQLVNQALQLSGLGRSDPLGVDGCVGLLPERRNLGSQVLALPLECLMFCVQGGALIGQGFQCPISGMLQRQGPPLPRQNGHGFWRVGDIQAGALRLQSPAERLPPSLKPPGHRIWRTGTQMRANALDRRSFARGDQFVGCCMDVGFGDASGHENASYADALLC